MSENKDYNILLLKVLAHDLLAPLTSVKWQTELLSKDYKKKDKRERYLQGIASSTELGISLTKHAHVAAKVLSGSYEVEDTEGANLGAHIKEAIDELTLQYERHALVLEADIQKSEKEKTLDVSLITLYVWSTGKFFLSCTPPNTKVTARGERNNDGAYVFSVSAENIPDSESCLKAFSSGEDFGTYDQKYVFATLMKEVAAKISATIETKIEGDGLAIATTFT